MTCSSWMMRLPLGLALCGFLPPGPAEPAQGEAESRPLRADERLFLHAAALLARDPENSADLAGKATKSAEKEEWKEDGDPVVKVLQAIEANPEYREAYRRSLKAKLGDNPRRNRQQLLDQLKADFTGEKVMRYRKVIVENARNLDKDPRRIEGTKLEAGALPWPICILFKCCD